MITHRIKAEKNAREKDKATVYNANGTFAGETTFSEVNANSFTEPASNAGTT
jgi:hypothetical protein